MRRFAAAACSVPDSVQIYFQPFDSLTPTLNNWNRTKWARTVSVNTKKTGLCRLHIAVYGFRSPTSWKGSQQGLWLILSKQVFFFFFSNVAFGKMPRSSVWLRRRKKCLQNLATRAKTTWTDEEGCRSEEEDVFDSEVNSQVSSCSRILDCDGLKNRINKKSFF